MRHRRPAVVAILMMVLFWSGPAYAKPGITNNGTSGPDVIFGSRNNDTLNGSGSVDNVFGMQGKDTVGGGTEPDFVFGGRGDDTLYGSDGDDFIVDDDASFDTMSGFSGADTFYAANGAKDKINCSGLVGETVYADPVDKVLGCDNVFTGTSPLRIYGTNGNDHNLAGGIGNELIFGRRGDDKVYGGFGNDLLMGGPGRDHLDGGPDNDTIYDDDGGHDVLLGGDGADVLYAADGVQDSVDCGAGASDVAYVDAKDLPITVNCEVVWHP